MGRRRQAMVPSLASPLRSPAKAEDNDISIWWYAAALVVYIVGGFLFQSVLLNWIVGPLFPLAVLYVLPNVLRRVSQRARARTEPAE